MAGNPANAGPADRDELSAWLVLDAAARRSRIESESDPAGYLIALGDRCEQWAAADVPRALEASQAIEDVSRAMVATTAAIRATRARVTAFAYAGRLSEALDLAERSIAEATAAGAELETVRLAVASMQPLSRLGRAAEALARGRHARESLERLGRPELAARADLNLANVLKAQGESAGAIEHLERARNALRHEPAMLAPLENTLGTVLLHVDDFAGCRREFESSRDRYRSLGAAFAEAMVEGNLADLAAREGRLDEALAGFERARRAFGADASSAAHRARLVAEEAEVLESIGASGEAVEALAASVAALERDGHRVPALRARFALARTFVALGLGEEATVELDRVARDAADLGERLIAGRTALLRSEIALATGDVGTASLAGVMADDAASPRIDRIVALRHLAEARLAAGQTAAAREAIARAFELLEGLDIPPLAADLLVTRAATRDSAEARLTDLERAVALVDRTRGSLRSERLRIAWLGRRLKPYEQLVAVCIARGDHDSLDRALVTVERAKSRTLLDLVHRALDRTPGRRDPGDPLLAELEVVRTRLNALYAAWSESRVEGERHGPPPSRTRAIAAAETRIDELMRRLGAVNDERSLHAEPLSAAEIRGRLAPTQRLVEIFRAGDSYLALVVSTDGIAARIMAASAELIEAEVRKALFQLRRGVRASLEGHDGSLVEIARRHLGRLYRMLLEPLEPELAECERLLVVPHGPLHALPFGALHDGQRWLAERFHIAHAPSASLALARSRGDGAGPALLVGVADRAAPAIDDEIDAIATLHQGSTTLSGPAATPEAVRAAVAGRGLVHFACHGRFLEAFPAASGLRLADRWMPVRELLELPLSASLVVLSACESGRSEVEPGEELIGLARSLLAAGAQATIVSHWPVNDRIAAETMRSLHRGLAAGMAPAAALRSAALETMDRYPHPAAWAAFSLVGSGLASGGNSLGDRSRA